jgi:hypothetical protein
VEHKTVAGQVHAILSSEVAPWLEGTTGQTMGLVAYVALALACYLLARWGAEKQLGSTSRPER